MDTTPPLPSEQQQLERRLAALLVDPRWAGHPLRDEAAFFAEAALQSGRTLAKLIKISDAMQAQLNDQRLELERLNRQKDQLFSIIAHDLRGPFGTFLGGLDLLRSDDHGLDDHQRRALVATLHLSGERLAALLENLLEWGRLQLHQPAHRPRPEPLAECLAMATRLAEPAATAKGIELRALPTPLVALMDRHAVDTILRNLLGNAIKFTPRGGHVLLAATPSGGDIAVTVRDDGVGMDETTRQRLLAAAEPFHTRGTESEPGSGLGLLLARELAARHGGRLEVESAPGAGSTFRFTLPAAA